MDSEEAAPVLPVDALVELEATAVDTCMDPDVVDTEDVSRDDTPLPESCPAACSDIAPERNTACTRPRMCGRIVLRVERRS